MASTWAGSECGVSIRRDSGPDDATQPSVPTVSVSPLKVPGSSDVRPASAARLIRVSPRIREPVATDTVIVPVRPFPETPSLLFSPTTFQSVDANFTALDGEAVSAWTLR